MKASVDGHIIAQSDDVVACRGYQYFPQSAVRTDWLQKTEKTADDLKCPHSVQFYDVVVDGKRHKRARGSTRSHAQKSRRSAGASGFGRTSRSPDDMAAHSRDSGNPAAWCSDWVPAFAGTSGIWARDATGLSPGERY